LADDLVAEDEGLVDEGEIAFEDVEVGAAYSAGEDAEKHVARREGGAGNFFDLEGMVGGVEDGGFHLNPRGFCAVLVVEVAGTDRSVVG
jgi:hypothetical protein